MPSSFKLAAAAALMLSGCNLFGTTEPHRSDIGPAEVGVDDASLDTGAMPDIGRPPDMHVIADAAADADSGATDMATSRDAGADTADAADDIGVDLGPPVLSRRWEDSLPPTNPGALWSPAMVYHQQRQTVLLYGGRLNPGSAGPIQASMWEYDGNDWSLVCDPCDPGPRVTHGMVYDSARDRVVLLGGLGTSAAVWEWDGTGWASYPAPAALDGYEGFWAGYDPVRQRSVFYRGQQIYEWDGANFTSPLPANTPASRYTGSGESLAYDPDRAELILFGGTDGSQIFDDMWGWDGVNWQRICDDCTGVPRESTHLGYDPSRDVLVLVGGWTGSAEIDGTWEFALGSWTKVSELPTRRDSGAFVWAGGWNRFVFYGGNGAPCSGNCDDTYEYVPVFD